MLGVRWAFPMPTSLVTRAQRERLVLGRAADCDVVLAGAETSRHHAEMRQQGPLWTIEDLGSKNGVYVNGRRVKREALSLGDVLRVGEWIGVVRRVSSATEDDEVPFGELTPGIFGSSVLARVLEDAKKAANSSLRVVIQGETGTGKECVAQAIHAWSGRSGKFVAVNCAALPEALAESELFGHRKGAFTGADQASAGHLRSAHGGTLLLDEITDLPLTVQAKLLRALEERAVVPLGESMPIRVDVRVIAATQKPLRTAVEQNRFRADLWARVDGLTISLPPLRERSEDAPQLFACLMPRAKGCQLRIVDAGLIEQLCLYDWPRNVREVAQLAQQLAVIHENEPVLKRSHLPKEMLHENTAQTPPVQVQESIGPASAVELGQLEQALRRNQGNVAAAARELGISRGKAYRWKVALPDRVLEEIHGLRRRPVPPDVEREHDE